MNLHETWIQRRRVWFSVACETNLQPSRVEIGSTCVLFLAQIFWSFVFIFVHVFEYQIFFGKKADCKIRMTGWSTLKDGKCIQFLAPDGVMLLICTYLHLSAHICTVSLITIFTGICFHWLQFSLVAVFCCALDYCSNISMICSLKCRQMKWAP